VRTQIARVDARGRTALSIRCRAARAPCPGVLRVLTLDGRELARSPFRVRAGATRRIAAHFGRTFMRRLGRRGVRDLRWVTTTRGALAGSRTRRSFAFTLARQARASRAASSAAGAGRASA
jgi:hypothetical protein